MTTIVTRASKDSALSYAEMDANFTNLNIDKVETVSPTTSGTLTHSGDVFLSGSGQHITGDFSNATIANRVMLQTSTVNGATNIHAVPSGTGNIAGFKAESSSDVTNSSYATIDVVGGSHVSFASGVRGASTYLPMAFYTGGSERMRIDTSGNVLVTNPSGLGYGTGSGGAVTQATSKSTAVTLNKPTGRITMSNAALGAGAVVGFYLNTSLLGISDVLVVNVTNANGVNVMNYRAEAHILSAGVGFVKVTNTSGGSLSEAVVISFAIIKGSTT